MRFSSFIQDLHKNRRHGCVEPDTNGTLKTSADIIYSVVHFKIRI